MRLNELKKECDRLATHLVGPDYEFGIAESMHDVRHKLTYNSNRNGGEDWVDFVGVTRKACYARLHMWLSHELGHELIARRDELDNLLSSVAALAHEHMLGQQHVVDELRRLADELESEL